MNVSKLPKILQEIPMSGGGYAEAYEVDGGSLADNRGYPSLPHSKGGTWTIYYQIDGGRGGFMYHVEDDVYYVAEEIKEYIEDNLRNLGYPYIGEHPVRILDMGSTTGRYPSEYASVTVEFGVTAYWD